MQRNWRWKNFEKNVMVVGAGVKTGLNIRMDNPSSVGSDLIVGAVAGVAQYPVPLIILIWVRPIQFV